MGFLEVIQSPISKIILSILWGLGLSTLFRRACRNRSCIIIRGPRPLDMEGKIYSFDNKCYIYKARLTECPVENIKYPSSFQN